MCSKVLFSAGFFVNLFYKAVMQWSYKRFSKNSKLKGFRTRLYKSVDIEICCGVPINFRFLRLLKNIAIRQHFARLRLGSGVHSISLLYTVIARVEGLFYNNII